MTTFVMKKTLRGVVVRFTRNGIVWRWEIGSFQSKHYRCYREAFLAAQKFLNKICPANLKKCMVIGVIDGDKK